MIEDDADLASVRRRLTQLERTVRRQRAIFLGVGLVALASSGTWLRAADSGEKVIEATRLVIRDEKGTARAVLGGFGSRTGLALMDATGETRVTMMADENDGGAIRVGHAASGSITIAATKDIALLATSNAADTVRVTVDADGLTRSRKIGGAWRSSPTQ